MKTRILFADVNTANSVQRLKFAGIRRYAEWRGMEAVMVPRAESHGAEFAREVRRPNVLGCIVQSRFGRPVISSEVLRGVPAVYFDANPELCEAPVPSVTSDDGMIARAAVRELAASRPASLAYVGYTSPAPWSFRREEAFLHEARAAGLPHSVFPHGPKDTVVNSIAPERIAKWLPSLARPCAVMAVNDNLAAAVVVAARMARLSVPRDIAVIGVDNFEQYGEAVGMPISSVVLDHERAGFLAAKALDALARRPGAGDSPPVAAAPVLFGPLMVVRRRSTSGRGRHEGYILKAVEQIRAEACDGLTPGRLMARFPVSRWLFEMRFREATGHSVLDEILGVRLERACAMLASSDTPVSVIADMCGFGSYDAMHDLMRKHFAATPTQFRALHRS